ncbi:MAG: hypothetical protein ABI721_02210 [Candidatus Dojkabacteria bacterium]
MEERHLYQTRGTRRFYEARRTFINSLGYRDIQQLQEETFSKGESPVRLSHILEYYIPLLIKQGIVCRIAGKENYVIQSAENSELWFCTTEDLGYNNLAEGSRGAYIRNYVIHPDFINFINKHRNRDHNIPEGAVEINKFLTDYCSERGINIPRATIQSARNQGNIKVLAKGPRNVTYGDKNDLIRYAENYIQRITTEEP